MKRSRLLMILLLILLIPLIVVMLAVIAFRLLVSSIEGSPRPHAELKEQAEIAIKKAGGAGVLEQEAKAILSHSRQPPHEAWLTFDRDRGNYPATAKLHKLLAADGHYPWVVGDQRGLPAHVVIRFGSHAHYVDLWMFDPANRPLGNIADMEHLSGAVYLSEAND